MNRYTVENLTEPNSLLARVDGPLRIGPFPQWYGEKLDHPDFQKNVHFIWDALSSSIAKLKVEDLKPAVYALTQTESRQGKGCSAWILAEGRSYDDASLSQAAFADGLKIRHGVFSTAKEARDWIIPVETRSLQESPAI